MKKKKKHNNNNNKKKKSNQINLKRKRKDVFPILMIDVKLKLWTCIIFIAGICRYIGVPIGASESISE